MNKHLQRILEILQQENLTAGQKSAAIEALKDANKELEITAFKLDKTEKVKHTTAILLEETIAELEQKRKAVEVQNRELEIEAALERVRSRSMGMHRVEDLKGVVKEVYTQLKLLGFKLGVAAINIIDGATGDMDVWMDGLEDGYELPESYHVPYFNHPGHNQHLEHWKNGVSYAVIEITGPDKKTYDNYFFFHTDFVKVPEHTKNLMMSQESLISSMAYMKYGAIGWAPAMLNEEQTTVLQRFAKVFEQTYTRFLDLQKAEAQAREAQIEAALERVRSRTMGMQKSEDLREVVKILYAQLIDLGFKWGVASITIMDQETGDIDWWMEGFEDGYDLPEKYHVPNFDHRGHREQITHWKNGTPYAVIEIAGQEKKKYDNYYFYQTDFVRAPENTRQLMMQQEVVLFSMAYMQYGALSWSPSPLTDDQSKILQRFAKVFEQTYTRFLDLQKAEAQAREAQIEAAMERIRSRALAMHHSGELRDVIAVFFEKLIELGTLHGTVGIGLYDNKSKDISCWVGNAIQDPQLVVAPFDQAIMEEENFISQSWKAMAEKTEMVNVVYSREQKDRYFKHLFAHNDLVQIPESAREILLKMEKHTVCFIPNHHSSLFVDSWDGKQYSAEDITILRRGGKVFEQAYQRFLDLQKAETQAREAQIEAALEKVRSRSLAMHNSSELKEVVIVVFEKLKELGLTFDVAGIQLYTEGTKDIVQWVAAPDLVSAAVLVSLPYFEKDFTDSEIVRDVWTAKETGQGFHNKQYSFEEKNRFFEYASRNNDYTAIPADVREFQLQAPGYTQTLIAQKHSALWVDSYRGQTISEAEFRTLGRFASVFEQAYVRFLDLQKAEAQAREAEVELALERVRARTMAMHNSSELIETAELLFDQLKQLGAESLGVAFAICEPDNILVRKWTSIGVFSVPYTSEPGEQRMYEAWMNKEEIYEEVYEGERIRKYYELLMEIPEFRQGFQKMLDSGYSLPIWQKNHAVTFKYGYLLLITTKPFEETIIFKRFAKVFEQTYTRFLDLQKAEAQAREARIEAALERVRSRSLAMHKSDELREVIQLVFEQLRQLNFNIDSAQFNLNYKESDDLHVWTAIPGQPYPTQQDIPYFINPIMDSVKHAKENGLTFLSHVTTHEEKNEFFQHFFNHVRNVPEDRKKFIFESPGYARSVVFLDNLFLGIQNYEGIPYSETENAVLSRFGKVFQQSYTRFLDLQKAEAQARESQIQLALERVRAKTMAMQSSNDLLGVANVLREQMGNLGQPELESSIVHLYNDNSPMLEAWYAFRPPNLASREIITGVGIVPKDCSAWSREVMVKYNSSETEYTIVASGDKLLEWYKILEQYASPTIEYDEKGQLVVPEILHYHFSKFSGGALLMISNQAPSSESRELQRRAAVVFDLAYTRFLDLKKAEAQAREAKIEAALEKVRSRSLAMHNSSELSELVATLFDELIKLDLVLARCIIWILNEDKSAQLWMANSENKQSADSYHINQIDHDYIHSIFKGWQERSEHWIYELKDTEKASIDQILLFETELSQLPEEVKNGILAAKQTYVAGAFNKFGLIEASGPVHHTEEQLQILHRFNKVFEQSYTRFLDLQKAEAQAREAQIETALERIRSAAMAMHSSEGILKVTQVLREQIALLGEKELESILVHIYHEDMDQFEAWYSYRHPENTDLQIINGRQMLSWSQTARAREDKKRYHEDAPDYCIVADYNMLKEWYEYLLTVIPEVVEVTQEGQPLVPEVLYYNYSKIAGGALLLITNSEASDHLKYLLRRTATVFNLAYSRFLDLQKAEAQAREAQIEAALERVRGKAMAMHSSEDLAATISAFYHELELFSITPRRCGVGLLDKETHMAELSTMNTTEQGESIEVIGRIKMVGHPVLEGVFDNWLKQKEYHPVLRGREISEYYQLIRPQVAFPEYPNDVVQYGYFFFFVEGGVYAWTEKPLSEDELKIYRRFTTVLSLTYKRYKDLRDAEAREQEAIKQAALDRVRADIASMRSTTDLDRITPLIWNELTTLGVPFIRCGVFIMDESENKVHTYLSTPDGRAIAAYHIAMDDSGSLSEAIDHWRQQNVYVTRWVESDFQTQADILLRQGAITTREEYLSTVPKGGFYLHFLPFRQGMLYVGSNEPLESDSIQLVQSLADTFSVAYARYEDFTRLESAKAQIEKTLTDLKQTQTQLIQSEKMASLGELTAGIAHEIQNPLNFVNNFSEVSKELLDEMKAELDKGNPEEAKALAADIIQNLEKINFHGKRADGIVKSMLQHSRKSTDQKELTDLNALCDEYLRLSYHGLRAKDKSFNAKFEIQCDPELPKLNVLPQDVGRVILNLINNAFYAVSERLRQAQPDSGYEPMVTVSTKNVGEKIEIIVKDNGNGIPDSIKEKIFQPFFTTKPTGQGTGLGLSLSYDIITKGHGGEIKMETKEGEGSEFIIILPNIILK